MQEVNMQKTPLLSPESPHSRLSHEAVRVYLFIFRCFLCCLTL